MKLKPLARGIAPRTCQSLLLVYAIGVATLCSAAERDMSSLPRARGNEGEWVRGDDYPAEALRAKVQGTVSVELSLNQEGRVERCVPVESSGSLLLDGTACRLLSERGSYEPAKDKNGIPVSASITKRVRWQLPVRQAPLPELRAFRFAPVPGALSAGTQVVRSAATYGPAAPAPHDRPALLGWLKQEDYPAASLAARESGEVTAAFDVTEAGAAENCRVVRSSGYLRLDDATCALIEARARYRPAVDPAGKATRSSDVRAFRWLPQSGGIGGINLVPVTVSPN